MEDRTVYEEILLDLSVEANILKVKKLQGEFISHRIPPVGVDVG